MAAANRPLIAVLGASGLLGTAITRELAALPVRLRLTARRAAVVPDGCLAEAAVVTADLTEPGALEDAVAGADVVIHLVAHIAGPATWRVADGDSRAEEVNLGLIHELISVLRAGQREDPPVVVFAGSMSQAGAGIAARIDGSEPDRPLTAYDRQKLAAEQALEAATAEGVLRGITLRLATLFSQGTDPGGHDLGVVAAMLRRAFAGEPLTMWHDGTVERDLLCVDDAARAFVLALDHVEVLAGRHWLVGTGAATTIAELFSAIADVVAGITGKPPVPVVSVEPAGHSLETDQLDFVVDPSAFTAAVGWSAGVSLTEALPRAARAVAARPDGREAFGSSRGDHHADYVQVPELRRRG